MTASVRRTVYVAAAMVCLAGGVLAQLNRGTIEGIVTDPQGGLIPNAKVMVTSEERGTQFSSATNEVGHYLVLGLVPGSYRARFEAPGFDALEVTGIEVSAGSSTRIDRQLRLGETRQITVVAAEAPLIETSGSNFSTTIAENTIRDLPLAGRDLMQAVYLFPGVNNVGGPPGSNFGFNSQFGTFPDPTNVLQSNISVNGGQAGANAWYLDGNLNISSNAENVAVNPSPDAVAEFQLVANGFAAEYSRTGGAVFNVVMKSGTNRLHGTLSEYHRNDGTNARNPFTSIDSYGNRVKDRQLRFNDFGGTLGGPIVLPKVYDGRNQSFFFVSWNTNILRVAGEQVFNVPTARMRAGDFSEDPNISRGIWDPFTTVGPDANGQVDRRAFGTPVAGNPFGSNGCLASSVTAGASMGVNTCDFAAAIPGDRIDPIARYFMDSYPLPNYIDPRSTCPMGKDGFPICNNFLGGVGGEQRTHNVSVKTDHQFGKSKYFFEWLYNPATYRNHKVPWKGPSYPASSVGYGSRLPLNVRSQILALGHTYVATPTLINEFRYSFSRQFMSTTVGTQDYLDDVAAQSEVLEVLAPLQIPVNAQDRVPNFGISMPGGRGLNFGPPTWENVNQMSEAHTMLDNVTKIVGRHSLKTGFIYRLEHAVWDGGYPTSFGFSGGLTRNPYTNLGAGRGVAQFLLGAVQPNSTGFYHGPYIRSRYWGAYFQDEVRVTPNLTLHLGLRWDLYGWPRTRRENESRFCLDCPNSLTGLKGKVVYQGDPEFTKGHDIFPAHKKNFGPRVNFSWVPLGNQKTVIRGGYNIFTSNAANFSNSPVQFIAPGWQQGFDWVGSYNPDQCAPFSGQCVVFPLSDTTTNKANLTFPPFVPGGPANRRDPLLGQDIGTMIRPSKVPMVQMWSLGIQQQMPGAIVLEIGYVGNRGTHLTGEINRQFSYVHTADLLKYRTAIDASIPITDVYSGQAAAMLEEVYGSDTLPRSILLRDYPFFPGIRAASAFDGTSIYHGMNVRAQKRYSAGYHFIAAYTFSKKITNAQTINLASAQFNPIAYARSGGLGGRAGAGSFGGATFQDRDNWSDRIIAADDITHMFSLAATYEPAMGKGKRWLNTGRVQNIIFGGWRLSGTFTAQSGLPMSFRGPANEMTDWLNVIGDPMFSGDRTKEQRIEQWFNPAAFEPVFGSDPEFWQNYDRNDDRAWRFGNAGARLPFARSPGFWNLDSSLSKRIPVGEDKYFDFRWEVFNTLNHMNLGLPDTNWCLPPGPNGEVDAVRTAGCSFGRITNIQTDPRAMQFGLKFVF